jgi:3-methyladenine DNA glycosylase/8-oxoguanine DNA glycosylase
VLAGALELLRGEPAGRAARGAGYPDVEIFTRDCLRELHAMPDALRRWAERGRYRIVYGGPFHLDQTLGYLSRDPHNLAEHVHGRRYSRWFPLSGSTAHTAVSLHLGALDCTVEARRPRSAERALELHLRLVRFLGLRQPLADFYRTAGKHPVMGPLVRRFPGVRIPQLPTLWEALCWAVIGQQINLAFAYRLRNRFIAIAHGVALPDPRNADPSPTGGAVAAMLPPIVSLPLAFPSPEQALALTPEDLLAQQFSRQKARYILGLAAACRDGELSALERGVFTHPAPTSSARAPRQHVPPSHDWAAIEETLLAQAGLGPWSAAYAMMRGLGYLDGLPVGDSGLRSALQREFKLKHPPTIAEQERLMEPFRPYRSLATYYLWKSLASTSTD